MHRSFLKRLQKKMTARKAKITPMQIVLVLVVVLVTYKLIVHFAEYTPPSPE